VLTFGRLTILFSFSDSGADFGVFRVTAHIQCSQLLLGFAGVLGFHAHASALAFVIWSGVICLVGISDYRSCPASP
jgi:hypothetical protein